jgi:hypothetical protein
MRKNGKMAISTLCKAEINDGYIDFDKVYHVWSFDNNSAEQQVEQFYLECHQKVIEQNYATFKTKPNHSFVNIGFPNQPAKYKVTFNPPSQVNISTQNVVQIRRKEVKFSSTIK